jgi:hypothetical protein
MVPEGSRLQVLLSLEGARLARLTADAGGLAAFWAQLRALAPHARAVGTREELHDVGQGAACLLLLPPKDAVWLNLSRRFLFDRKLCILLWHPEPEVRVWEDLAPDLLSVATTRFCRQELPARIVETRADLERRSRSGPVLVAWDGVDTGRVWPDAPVLDPRSGQQELMESVRSAPVRRWSVPVSHSDLQRLVRAERAVGAGLGVITGPLPSHLPWPTVGARELDPRTEIEERGAEAALATGFVSCEYPERGSQTEMQAGLVVEADDARAVADAPPEVDLLRVEALGATDPHAALQQVGTLDPTHPGHVRGSPMRARLYDRVGASDRALQLVGEVLGSGPPPEVATELADLAVAIHLRRNDLPAAIALVQRALPLVERAAQERLELARQGWERALASARAAAPRLDGGDKSRG